MIDRLRTMCGQALVSRSMEHKGAVLAEIAALVAEQGTALGSGFDKPVNVVDPSLVGLPPEVELVAPRALARRSWGTVRGRVATLHALAHIEANAVNLALDAAHRFDALPESYYRDWIGVAIEEFGHFELLCRRLESFDARYGDLACHGGLWDVAATTTTSVLERMALVPMVFEARGLDVTPGLIERFTRHGDHDTAAVLEVVLADEIGHVDVGVRWFRFACEREGLELWQTFRDLVEVAGFMIVPPFNESARVECGYPTDLLASWESAFVGSTARVPRKP